MTTADATSPDFTEWLTRNPQPGQQDLVQRYGGYHRVPADAWAQFDLDIADWQARSCREMADRVRRSGPQSIPVQC